MAELTGLRILATYPQIASLFLQVFLATNLVTGILYFGAKKWRLLPAIRERDVHRTRKPRIGGLAMWLVIAISLIALSTGGSGLLHFTDGAAGPMVLQGIFGGLLVILTFGLLDDLFGLAAGWQLLGQFVAASSVVMGGMIIPVLRLPVVGNLTLSPFWSAVIIIGWIMVMINAVNLFDGLDGLAGSIGLTASFFLLLVSLKLGFVGAATLCLVLFGAVAGFLPWNWHPAKLFMGTVGSQLLGFLLGVIAVVSGAKVATAVLVLGIPLFDAVSVVVRRLRAHQPPFKADQRHLHHRLLKIGLKPQQVVFVTNGLAVAFGILALGSQQANQKGLLILLLLGCMLLFIYITYVLERKAIKPVE